jgi:meso-butanediol dehydrogenase/(S,S)-butanediol dehydrogenase/diacetyl reductase
MADWSNRVAVVTGAGSGIGRATAERMASEGGAIVAVDLTDDSLAWTENASRVSSVSGDVTKPETNQRAIQEALRLGGLNTVVLNAGIGAFGAIDQMDLTAFDRVLDVNLRAVVLGIRAALPALRAADFPSIVVTASVSGLGGDPGMWAYNASKGGVANLVRALSLDLGREGIRVNAVCPGPIHTGMTAGMRDRPVHDQLRRHVPLGRWGEPAEVAAVISFLASPDASYVNGALVPVDGGAFASTGQFTPWPE